MTTRELITEANQKIAKIVESDNAPAIAKGKGKEPGGAE